MPPWLPDGFRAIALALAVLLFSNCSSIATIRRRSGPPLEAKINDSSRDKLYVTTPRGDDLVVDRSDVVEIDHPGKRNLTIGIVAAALGTFVLVGANTRLFCRHDSPCVSWETWLVSDLLGGDLILASFPFMATGLWAYESSVTAAKPAPLSIGSQAEAHDLPRLACSFCAKHQETRGNARADSVAPASPPPQR
jgi:hypothetical protein